MGKLKQASLVKKVSKEELECCNPLTVASNAAGKLRLCIDLSRRLNEVVKAPKFMIESTPEALQVVKPNDWAFVFDLKSRYEIEMFSVYFFVNFFSQTFAVIFALNIFLQYFA